MRMPDMMTERFRPTWARTMLKREKLAIATIYVPVKRRATLSVRFETS
jgi:hypothetical protein